MATRSELVTALAERYARSKAERGVILDESVAVSGYRAVKAWRAHRARRIILDSATLLAAGAADPAASADVVPRPRTPTPAGRPRGSTATPRPSLRQAREGHGAMRGSALWTPWTTASADTRPSVTFSC
jgi:hypothetical protein